MPSEYSFFCETRWITPNISNNEASSGTAVFGIEEWASALANGMAILSPSRRSWELKRVPLRRSDTACQQIAMGHSRGSIMPEKNCAKKRRATFKTNSCCSMRLSPHWDNKNIIDLLSCTSEVSPADSGSPSFQVSSVDPLARAELRRVDQEAAHYFPFINAFSKKRKMFNNFLLKLHVGQPHVFSKEVRPFPIICPTISYRLGPSMYVRPFHFSTWA